MEPLQDLHELIAADIRAGDLPQGVFEVEVASWVPASVVASLVTTLYFLRRFSLASTCERTRRPLRIPEPSHALGPCRDETTPQLISSTCLFLSEPTDMRSTAGSTTPAPQERRPVSARSCRRRQARADRQDRIPTNRSTTRPDPRPGRTRNTSASRTGRNRPVAVTPSHPRLLPTRPRATCRHSSASRGRPLPHLPLVLGMSAREFSAIVRCPIAGRVEHRSKPECRPPAAVSAERPGRKRRSSCDPGIRSLASGDHCRGRPRDSRSQRPAPSPRTVERRGGGVCVRTSAAEPRPSSVGGALPTPALPTPAVASSAVADTSSATGRRSDEESLLEITRPRVRVGSFRASPSNVSPTGRVTVMHARSTPITADEAGHTGGGSTRPGGRTSVAQKGRALRSARQCPMQSDAPSRFLSSSGSASGSGAPRTGPMV